MDIPWNNIQLQTLTTFCEHRETCEAISLLNKRCTCGLLQKLVTLEYPGAKLPTPRGIQVRAYKGGVATPIENVANPHSVVLEVEFPDGRTVQLSVEDTGGVNLRGWGNIPAKVGNGTKLSLAGVVNPQEQTTCPVCYHRLGKCGCDA